MLAGSRPVQHSQTHVHDRPITFSQPNQQKCSISIQLQELQYIEASCVNAQDGFGGLRMTLLHSYHVYQEIWEAAIREELVCEREPRNPTDRYAVAVLKYGVIIGHIPRTILQVYSLFLRRGGTIHCTVTGR